MLRVLTYHRIAEPASEPLLHPRLVSATPRVFRQHLQHLERHYTIVTLREALAAFRGEGVLPRRAVLLTFDDAYRDFLDTAWPLLRAHSMPATMFVPTAFPDQPKAAFWWDRLHRCFQATTETLLEHEHLGKLPLRTPEERRRALAAVQTHLKVGTHETLLVEVDELAARLGEPPFEGRATLSWDELRGLSGAGVTLAAHTRSHPLLPRVAPETARREVEGSLMDLEREIGPVLPVFSYPSGAHDAASVAAVRAAGIELAFTQVDGHNHPGETDLLRLRRTNITRRTSVSVLAIRLQTWFTPIDRWRHRTRQTEMHHPGAVHGTVT